MPRLLSAALLAGWRLVLPLAETGAILPACARASPIGMNPSTPRAQIAARDKRIDYFLLTGLSATVIALGPGKCFNVG